MRTRKPRVGVYVGNEADKRNGRNVGMEKERELDGWMDGWIGAKVHLL